MTQTDLTSLIATLDQKASDAHDSLIALRHHLHQNPELSNREVNTSALIAQRLQAAGLDEVWTGITGHGVVGVLHGKLPGTQVVALRADIDALPVKERSGSDVSTHPAARVPVSDPFDEFHAHLAFVSRIQAQFSLPYRDPGPMSGWTRTNGSAMLTLRPARLLDKEGKPYDAYHPYGVIPRLLLTWLVTQVKQTGERSISLGPSLRAFMRDLGIHHSVKGNAAVIEQTKRLIQSSFVLTMDDTSGGVSTHAMQGLMIASRAQLWFTAKMEFQPALLESEIELSQEFYDSIMETAIPVDMRHLAALRRQGGGGLSVDMYVQKTTHITWEQLAEQFGNEYTRARDFRKHFSRALDDVLSVHKGFNVSEWDEHGIAIKPGRTPIPKIPIPMSALPRAAPILRRI